MNGNHNWSKEGFPSGTYMHTVGGKGWVRALVRDHGDDTVALLREPGKPYYHFIAYKRSEGIPAEFAEYEVLWIPEVNEPLKEEPHA